MRSLPLPFAVLAFATVGSSQQLQWTEAHSLPPRIGSAVAYDSARERVVLFGGYSSGYLLADTWEWDGSAWIHRRPSTSPPARHGHCMAYDSARGRVVLFGGIPAALPYPNDTWEWDGTDWTLVVTPVSPPGLYDCMAFDEARQRTVLFGRAHIGGPSDTWEYDGVTWTQMVPVTSPAGRGGARMAYDSWRSRIVLYGGTTSLAVFPRDTWEWDGTTWVQASTPVAPTCHYKGSLAFDSVRGRTVLFGGTQQIPFANLDETWEWDGVSWQQQTPVQRPPAQGTSLVVFDRARGRTVVCGSDTRSDVWQWDGTAWTRSAPDQTPAIAVPQLLRDDWNGHVLAFGPARDNTFETWSWSGRRWTQLQPPQSPMLSNISFGTDPLRRISAASDPLRRAIVLFGGPMGQTWEWTGTTWTQALPAASPSPRFGHRMAFDHVTNRVLLFGGGASTPVLNDTWAYDGTTWSQLMPATSPPSRSFPGMVTDPVRLRVVMFGGFDSTETALGDTWEWDGGTWMLVATSGPSARGAVAMDYDPVGQRAVMFGGHSQGNVSGDTWAWDGTSWTNLGLVQAPRARSDAGLAWDAEWGHHLLLGGRTCDGVGSTCGPDHATWTLSSVNGPGVVPFGTGCGGPLGAPVHAGDEPYVGSDGFSLEVTNTPANAPCLFGLSATQQALPLGSGCTLYLGFTMDSWFTFANAGGVARVRLSIPASMAFLGATVFTQAAVWDPLGPFGGLSLSAARQLTIGL